MNTQDPLQARQDPLQALQALQSQQQPDQQPQRYTIDEVVQMLQAMSAAPAANGNPYEPDANGQFQCDPNDPICRKAMLDAGVQPPPQIPQSPPTGPTGPIKPGHPRPNGPGGYPSQSQDDLQIRRRRGGSPRPLMGYGMSMSPQGLGITRPAGAQPL